MFCFIETLVFHFVENKTCMFLVFEPAKKNFLCLLSDLKKFQKILEISLSSFYYLSGVALCTPKPQSMNTILYQDLTKNIKLLKLQPRTVREDSCIIS